MDYNKKKEERPIIRYKETFELDTIDFIDECWDVNLSDRLFEVITKTILDGQPTGNFRKGMVSLADAISSYLRMGSMLIEKQGNKILVEEMGCMFFDVLDFFCFDKDHPCDEEAKEGE